MTESVEKVFLTEIISGNTLEEFLKNFEGAVRNGYTLVSVDPFFGMGVWQVTMKGYFIKRDLRAAANKIELVIRDSKYTLDELSHATWPTLLAVAKNRGVKIRTRHQIIKDILMKQEN